MKIQIDVREIFGLYERMKTINSLNIMDIEFIDGLGPDKDNPYVISVSDELKKKFSDTGLSNMNFITDYYFLNE
jgi:hypothetical protein